MERINKFTIITVLYITFLIISNIMAAKIANYGWFIGPSGILIYPFCFMVGDVLTEVYGYKTAKKVIFLGFYMMFLITLFTSLGTYLPTATDAIEQGNAFKVVFGLMPRITVASFIGYIFGELANSRSLEFIKKFTGQKLLFIRTIGSTVIGQIVDSILFFSIAFVGVLPGSVIMQLIITQYVVKVVVEAIGGTPLAYLMVRWAKKNETDQTVSEYASI